MDERIDLTEDRLFRSSRDDTSWELHEEMPDAEWIEDSILAKYKESFYDSNPRFYVLSVYRKSFYDLIQNIHDYGITRKVINAVDFHDFIKKISKQEKIHLDTDNEDHENYMVSYNYQDKNRTWEVNYNYTTSINTTMSSNTGFSYSGGSINVTSTGNLITNITKEASYQFGQPIEPKSVRMHYLDSEIDLTDQPIDLKFLANLIEWDNPEILDELNFEMRQFTTNGNVIRLASSNIEFISTSDPIWLTYL